MTIQNVPVDGRGLDWPRKVANAVNRLQKLVGDTALPIEDVRGLAQQALEAAGDAADAAAAAMSMAAGFGFIDYTDNDAPAPLEIAADTEVQVERDLSPALVNQRLRGPWAGHEFWDNGAKVIQARALYDRVTIAFAIRLIADVANGEFTLSLIAGTINVKSETRPLTAPVGEEESMNIEFTVPMRSAFVANGAKIMLTSTVDVSVIEFSPEFYPESFEP